MKAIAVTAELTNTEMSESALEVFEADLAEYSDRQILAALTRCRRELRGRLTVADVVDRMASVGGHPSANEAWALVLAAADESETVVWTEQVAEAAGIAQPVLDAGDEVGARMAFETHTSGLWLRTASRRDGSRALDMTRRSALERSSEPSERD